MNPNEFGKKLGIGLRVAGRIAQQQLEASSTPQSASPAQPSAPTASTASNPAANSGTSPGPNPASNPTPPSAPRSAASFVDPQRVRQAAVRSHNITRAAGRGLGGFLRPFGKVGGLLWLEVTGFFFGLFALFFAQNIWRARMDYASGPQHQRFLIGVGLTLVFSYLSISAFWRARRK